MRLWVRLTFFVRSLGQAGLWSDIPTGSGFGSSTFLSDLWVKLTFGQMYPPRSGFRSGSHFVRSLGQADVWSDIPPPQSPQDQASGQVDIFFKSLGKTDLYSDVPPTSVAFDKVDIFVRTLGQSDLWSDVYPVQTSCGQVWYYIGQTDLWSDVPPR